MGLSVVIILGRKSAELVRLNKVSVALKNLRTIALNCSSNKEDRL
jgi:hypothetical protein